MSGAKPRQLAAFMQISLDGYYCDPRGDMSFAHKPPDDAEWQEFVNGNASDGGMLLFGRTTYVVQQLWPRRKLVRAREVTERVAISTFRKRSIPRLKEPPCLLGACCFRPLRMNAWR